MPGREIVVLDSSAGGMDPLMRLVAVLSDLRASVRARAQAALPGSPRPPTATLVRHPGRGAR